jgi:hypothetical protein
MHSPKYVYKYTPMGRITFIDQGKDSGTDNLEHRLSLECLYPVADVDDIQHSKGYEH